MAGGNKLTCLGFACLAATNSCLDPAASRATDMTEQQLFFVQISTMGDPDGNAQGGFLILDQDLKV